VEIAESGNNGLRQTAVCERGGVMSFLDKARDLVEKNADKVEQAIDKAGDFIDEKTDGKYKDVVDKVQDAAKNALEKDAAKDTDTGTEGNNPPA
jgi:hypothetical protein